MVHLKEQLLVALVAEAGLENLQVAHLQGLGPLEELQLAQGYPDIYELKMLDI